MNLQLKRALNFLSLMSVLGLMACSNSMKPSATNSTTASTSGDQNTPAPSPTPGPQAGPSPQPMPAPGPLPAPVGANCGLQTATSAAAFCETFDKPSSVFNRSGQVDGLVWGTSRLLSDLNVGRPWPWASTQIDLCGNVQTVNSPNDVQICNGQLREATNDNGGVMVLAMYPKQQFDFSGRVGTVAFDVTNDTAGTHATWPEFWMTDQPVPVPFHHFGSLTAAPTNGFGVRFGAYAGVNSFGICPNGNNLDKPRFTVDSAIVIRDWLYEDNYAGGGSQCADEYGASCVRNGNMKVTVKDCVIAPNGPNGGMNHIELKVAQNQIDVYATDAGTKAPLKLIATLTNANLTLSRGFIWIQDAHYNASKGPENDPLRPFQTHHTYAWDNIAFDGPLIERERSFDVLESKVPADIGQFLGWTTFPGQPAKVETIPIPAADLVAAKTGALLFSFWNRDTPIANITYRINGKVHVAPWPFPDQQATFRTISLPVPLTELVMGPNKIEIEASLTMEVSNISISLQGAGGIVPPKLP